MKLSSITSYYEKTINNLFFDDVNVYVYVPETAVVVSDFSTCAAPIDAVALSSTAVANPHSGRSGPHLDVVPATFACALAIMLENLGCSRTASKSLSRPIQMSRPSE